MSSIGSGIVSFIKDWDIYKAAAYWQSELSGKKVDPKEVGTLEAVGTIGAVGVLLPYMILGCGEEEKAGPCDDAPSAGAVVPNFQGSDIELGKEVCFTLTDIRGGCGIESVTWYFEGTYFQVQGTKDQQANGWLSSTACHSFRRVTAQPYFGIAVVGKNGKSYYKEGWGLNFNWLPPAFYYSLSGESSYHVGDTPTLTATSVPGAKFTWVIPTAPSGEYTYTVSNNTVTFTFNSEIEFNIILVIETEYGYRQIERYIKVWPQEVAIPKVSIAGERSAYVGIPETYWAAVQEGDVTYTWDIACGTFCSPNSATATSITTTFTQTGTYEVILTGERVSGTTVVDNTVRMPVEVYP